jgi:bifunctional non-homologous end joining protein LigD
VFSKTSGSKGLQVYMRLNRVSVEKSGEHAHELAKAIEVDHPDLVVSNMRKELRKGKVLIDWSQNSPAKTTVAVYSLRARPEPTVSAPVTWTEIDACMRSGDPDELSFTATDVLRRVQRLGDLMAGLEAR